MINAAARVLLTSFVAVVPSGCTTEYETSPSSFTLPADMSPAASAAPEAAGAGNAPTALFVEFVVTPQDVVERMLKLARVTKGDVVYDLGCGDGRIVVTAARRYGCRAVGYDLDLLRVEEARKNVAKHKIGHLVTIEQQDVLHCDLQGASVVTLYLGTEINARLIPQLEKLPPGARIVSHDFPIGDLTPDKVVEMTSREDGLRHRIYLWTCPLTTRQK
jgi:ribosomal protein L11 methylase PrmA